MQQRLLELLRRNSDNEDKFTNYINALDFAVKQAKPFPSIDNQVIDPKTLSACIAEIRQVCEFPVRPETVASQCGQSPFQEALAKFSSQDEREPNVLDFILLYLRGCNGTMTVAKVLRYSLFETCINV